MPVFRQPSRVPYLPRSTWVPSKASGFADGSGTAALTFAGSAAGASGAASSGSAALTFAGSGAGASAAAGSGSATLTFAGSGSGASAAAGSGTSTLTFGGSASGASQDAGSGTAALTFSGSAAGAAEKAGAGSAALTFAGSAGGASVKAGSGASSVTFGGTASSAAAAAGSGAATLTFTGTGGGTPGGAGTTSVTFAGAGIGASVKAGSGAAAVTFTGTASGASEVGGSGIVSVTFAGSGFGAGAPPVGGGSRGFASTLPGTVFAGDPRPADLKSVVALVNAAHGGDANRAVSPEDVTAFYTPNVVAFQNLADVAESNGRRYVWWESEAADAGAVHTNRYALDLYVTDPVTARARIAYHANILDIWRARHADLLIGMEFGLPAVPAVPLPLAPSLAGPYAELAAYEDAALGGKIDFLVVVGYVQPGETVTQWRARIDFYQEQIRQRSYRDKPVHLLINHTAGALGVDYVGDAMFRAMLDAAAALGWDWEFWSATGAYADQAWEVIRGWLTPAVASPSSYVYRRFQELPVSTEPFDPPRMVATGLQRSWN